MRNRTAALNAGLIGAGIFFAVRMFAKTGAASKLSFFPKKINLRFQILTPILDVIIGIQNPTRSDFTVGSIVGQLFLNNSFVANIAGYQVTQIKALSEVEYPISARLALGGLTSEATSIVNQIISAGGLSPLSQQSLRFKGSVNAEGVTIPLDFTYKLPQF